MGVPKGRELTARRRRFAIQQQQHLIGKLVKYPARAEGLVPPRVRDALPAAWYERVIAANRVIIDLLRWTVMHPHCPVDDGVSRRRVSYRMSYGHARLAR